MTFLEPVIAAVVAAVIGAGTGAVAVFLQKNKTSQMLLKYGPVVKKAYDIIDPVLDQNLRKWKGSQVDKAFELAIESVADGKLSKEEVRSLGFAMAQAWLPQKAADKVRQFEKMATPAPELIAAAKIASKVNSVIN